MSPSKGSLPIKLRLPGCIPIRRLSGTHDPKMRKRLVAMLKALHETGRDDLVNGVARGTILPLQLYNRWKFSRLEDLPHADELPRFADVWPRWIRDMEASDDHRTACAGYCKRLANLMDADATLAALPGAVKEFRVLQREHAQTFNHARTTVLALLRDTLTRRHRLWLDVADIPELKVKPTRRKHPLTPDQLRDLVKRLGEPWGPMAWTMATTGMGWKEYAGAWEREGDGLRIHGTKTGGRDRLIPLVSLLHPCQGTVHAFRWHLTKHGGGVTPYDFRRTFMTLMVEAGVPRPRRRAYMGHTAEDISAVYEFQEVRDYLLRDAERIRAILGEPEGGPSLQMVRGMKIRLTHLDGKLPNLALMKLAHWHRQQGDEVTFSRKVAREMFEPEHDVVYGSAIFSVSRRILDAFRQEWPGAVVGGTGTDELHTVEQVLGVDDHEHYDYSLYPAFTGSIGFTQRGCRLRCGFCVVPKKEGKPRSVNTITQLWRGEPYPKHLHLLDNDFFGQPEDQWRARVEEILAGKFRVCFNQGINIRLITEEAAHWIAKLPYYDDGFKTRRLYTAWDNLKDEGIFFRGVGTLEDAGVPPTHLMVYMLVGYRQDETMDEVMYRFERMVARGIRPYPMVYDRERHPELRKFQRWAIRKAYTFVPFDKYDVNAKGRKSPDLDNQTSLLPGEAA